MKRLFFSLFAFLVSGTLFAVTDTVNTTFTGGQIQNAAVISANGSRYVATLPATRTWWVERSVGIIRLSYPLPAAASARPAGQAAVTLAVQYKVEENGAWVTRSANTTLNLDLKTATATDVAYFRAEGAQSISATLSAVSIPAGWPDIQLQASVITQSFDLLASNATTGVTLGHDASLTADGNLKVNWSAITGAEYYELEWTYVSDQGSDPSVTLAPSDIEVDPFLFRNNSSRVEVKKLSYEIPMIYEKGIIVYRLRAVGKNLVNSVPVAVKSEWTVPDGRYTSLGQYPQANLYVYQGLEQKLNWQSSLSFAEEGKHKVVLSYHDGSLRNRQAVTRINSDKRSIVGETWYDYNGRPSIQILPAPVTGNELFYYPHHNLIDGKTVLNKGDYDKAQAGQGCQPESPALSTGTGTSRYYSPDNNFGTTGNTGNNLLNKALIPDAQKYPYTQTYYTPDNTGRVAAQSGVGPAHRIGTGKETRYLYSIPQQPELTRLFGSQAGYARHYKKNAVIDANGQVSVSYLDLDGKVVATGLAGNSPDNVNSLGGNSSRSIKANLFTGSYGANETSSDGLRKIYSSKFIVTTPNIPYKFNYTAGIAPYSMYCYDNQTSNSYSYNFDGVADVQLLVVDKCGNQVINQNGSSVKGNTGTTQNITFSPQVTLAPGEYQITKTLTINEAKLDEYWQEYVDADGPCLLNQQDFINEELGKINTAGCGITCASCSTMVQNIIASNTTLTSEGIALLWASCNDVCADQDIACRSSLEAMKGDMSPGGQYGQLRKEKINQPAAPDVSLDENNMPHETHTDITLVSTDDSFGADPSDNDIDASGFPLSIYNENNRLYFAPILDGITGLPEKRASWHYPLQVQQTGYTSDNRKNQILFENSRNLMTDLSFAVTDYTDVNGDVFYVYVYQVDNTPTYKPAIMQTTEAAAALVTVDAENGLYKIPARHLQNLEDFEKYWQSHWANYLVPYHPEFQYFLKCTSRQASHSFDYKLINTTTFDQAVAEGYVSAGGTPLLLSATAASSQDPLLKSSKLYNQYMYTRDQNYQTMSVNGQSAMRTMAQVVTISLNCPRNLASCGITNCTDGKLDTDEEWNSYKGFYLAEKQKLLRNEALHTAVDSLYYNGCIGHKDYLSNPEAEYFRRPVTMTNTATRSYLDCRKSWQDILHWDWSCHTVTYTVSYNSTTYPYLNPGQLCYIGRAGDYEKKAQRFYPSNPSGMGGGQPAERCTTMVTNPDNPLEVLQINVPCQEDIQEASDLALEDARRFKYNSCGLCPMGADVELFLIDLHAEDVLVPSQNLLVSCDLKQYPVKMGETLRRQVIPSGNPGLEVYWSATLSPNGKVLTGQLFNGSTVLATIDLRIPDNISTTFNSLSKLCCLTVLASGQPVYYTYESGKNFTIEAAYINGTQAVDFKVEGKMSLPLSTCTITPRCMITDDATRVATFLTVLTTATSAGKQNELLTSNANVSLSASNIEFYDFAVKTLLKKDDRDAYNIYVDDISTLSPVWRSYMSSSDVLSGVLSYTENSSPHQIPIEVTGLTSTQCTQVSDFVNLRPESIDMNSNDPCITAPCDKQTFKADAVIISGSQRTYVPVTIYVSTMKPVVCNPPAPPSN